MPSGLGLAVGVCYTQAFVIMSSANYFCKNRYLLRLCRPYGPLPLVLSSATKVRKQMKTVTYS